MRSRVASKKDSSIWKTCNDGAPFEHGRKLHKAIREFGHYIAVNRAFVPNYGDRYRHGEAISTAFVESAVNQVVSKRMVKQQQMRWTQQGAHLLLQVRTQALNGDLRGSFCRWYPAWSVIRGIRTEWPPPHSCPRFVLVSRSVAVESNKARKRMVL